MHYKSKNISINQIALHRYLHLPRVSYANPIAAGPTACNTVEPIPLTNAFNVHASGPYHNRINNSYNIFSIIINPIPHATPYNTPSYGVFNHFKIKLVQQVSKVPLQTGQLQILKLVQASRSRLFQVKHFDLHRLF